MDEVYERNETKDMMASYMGPSRNEQSNNSYGYVVRDAPWSQAPRQENGPPPSAPAEYIPDKDNNSEFPVLGGKTGWGPWGGQ